MDMSRDLQKRHLLSLEEQTKIALDELAVINKEKSDWLSDKGSRDQALANLDEKVRVARAYAETTIAMLDAEILSRKGEVTRLQGVHKLEHESHARVIIEKKATIESQQRVIAENTIKISEQENRKEVLNSETSDAHQEKIVALKGMQTAQGNHKVELQALQDVRSKVVRKNTEYAKIHSDIERIKRTRHILVEDVLTDNHKRLFDRHQKQTGLSQELDKKIRTQKKNLKT